MTCTVCPVYFIIFLYFQLYFFEISKRVKKDGTNGTFRSVSLC